MEENQNNIVSVSGPNNVPTKKQASIMRRNFIALVCYVWIGFIPGPGLLIIPVGIAHMIVLFSQGIVALFRKQFDDAGQYFLFMLIIPLIGYGVCMIGLSTGWANGL